MGKSKKNLDFFHKGKYNTHVRITFTTNRVEFAKQLRRDNQTVPCDFKAVRLWTNGGKSDER